MFSGNYSQFLCDIEYRLICPAPKQLLVMSFLTRFLYNIASYKIDLVQQIICWEMKVI